MWGIDRESSQSKPTAFMKSSFLKSILSKWPSMHSGSARPVGQTGKTLIFLPQDANINIEVVPSNWQWDALVSALQSTASQRKSSVRPWSAVSTLRLKSLYFWIWATRLSTGTQPVLPKPLRTPYLGVGHQTGPGPLCGTPQSPSQSARTFCRRNNTKWAEFTLTEHSSSHSQIRQSTPNQPISFHPVFRATRRFLTVHNRTERKDWPLLSHLIFSSKTHWTHSNTPERHKHDTLKGQHLLFTHVRLLVVFYNTHCRQLE